jgi:succinoglycan biosynthesis transport protein ExoP
MNDQEIDLRAIFGVLRRHFRLIALVVITVMLVAGAVVYSLRPEYTATSLVFVDTARKDLLEPDAISGMSSSADNARVDSEVEIARSIPTLLRVIDDAGLLTDPEFMPRIGMRQQLMAFFRLAEPTLPTGEEAVNNLVDRLRNTITVQRRGLTYLIAINAEAASPATAARIANAAANAYIALQIQSKTQSILNSLDILEPRIAEAANVLASSEGAFDTFIEDNIDQIASQTGNQDLSALREQLAAAAAERERLGSVVEGATQSLAQLDYDQLVSSLQSEAIANLETQRTELLERLNALDPASQSAVDLRGNLSALENRLADTARQEIATLQSQVSSYQDQTTALRDQVRQRFMSSQLPPQVLTNIYELQQNAALARSNYERLVARVNDLRAQADLQIADSRVVAPATAPSTPSFPNSRLMLILAGLAALGLGVGLAFVVDNFIGGFVSQEQLEAVTRQEVGASLPLQKQVKRADGSLASSASDLVVTSPLSHYSESLRRLRLRIDQLLATKVQTGNQKAGGRVVLVTSSLPVEGKTTTALGLARTYGMAGLSVLIIDADLRKPSLHKHLDITSDKDLHSYLTGEVSSDAIQTIIKWDPLSSVSVIQSSNPSDVPTEQLLTQKTFVQLVEAARVAFDVVIVDTPPVGVVVDGIYLMQFADIILFLTHYASTTQSDVLRSIEAVVRSKPDTTPLLLAMTQQPDDAKNYKYRYASYYAAD